MIYKNICFKFGSFFKNILLTVSNIRINVLLEKKLTQSFSFYIDLINRLIISKEVSNGDDSGKKYSQRLNSTL